MTAISPEGHKHCRRCDTVKSLHLFRMKRKRNPSGSLCEYPMNVCIACQAEQDAERYERRKLGITLPPGRPLKATPEALYRRPPVEVECDAAFMGWRVAHHATVVAFQGPRL